MSPLSSQSTGMMAPGATFMDLEIKLKIKSKINHLGYYKNHFIL